MMIEFKKFYTCLCSNNMYLFCVFEKEDLFVKYHAVLYTIITLLILSPFDIISFCGVILVLYGFTRVPRGKVVNIPGLSQLVLKLCR